MKNILVLCSDFSRGWQIFTTHIIFRFFQPKSDHEQFFVYKGKIRILVCCPLKFFNIEFYMRFSNACFVFHGHSFQGYNFCFTSNLLKKSGCITIYVQQKNCQMRNIGVESSTLSTRHEMQSPTLSTTRPAEFTPFFVEF